MRTSTLTLFSLLLLLSSSLFAQTTEVIIIEEEEEEKSFQLSGYVDAYYQANFSNTDGEGEAPLIFPTSFTGQPNQFAIGNVNLLAEKSLGKVGFVGQIGFGPRAVAANGDSNVGGFVSANFAQTIQQLYVTYSPVDAVTFTLGNFGTFVGYEVIDANANVNYSTSYLFSNGPFYHTGIKADFAITEGFGAMIGLFNDTDSKIDAVSGKHLGLQLSAETGGLAAYFNLLTGKEDENTADDDDDLNELQLDLTATYEVGETFMLGINASNYSTSVDGDGQGGFFGTALYATVGVAEGFDLGFRAEYFADTKAEQTPDDFDTRSVTAFTLSGNYTVGDLRIIPEFRFDSGSNFNENNFSSINFGGGVDDNSAASFILAAVYSF